MWGIIIHESCNDEVGLWSSSTGLGKTIKKKDVLSIQEKCRMLAQASTSNVFAYLPI
jgi:hypothetical protein